MEINTKLIRKNGKQFLKPKYAADCNERIASTKNHWYNCRALSEQYGNNMITYGSLTLWTTFAVGLVGESIRRAMHASPRRHIVVTPKSRIGILERVPPLKLRTTDSLNTKTINGCYGTPSWELQTIGPHVTSNCHITSAMSIMCCIQLNHVSYDHIRRSNAGLRVFFPLAILNIQPLD